MTKTLARSRRRTGSQNRQAVTTSALTPEYRREMIRVFTKRAVLAAAAS